MLKFAVTVVAIGEEGRLYSSGLGKSFVLKVN
jgi:hypothetical protein